MKRYSIALLAVLAVSMGMTLSQPGVREPQSAVQNETLANRILAARQQDAALMKQYNWNSRVELTHQGKIEDIRIELVTPGPGGELQRSLMNDMPGALPNGFFRKAIAENQRKDLEGYLGDLRALADQYTLASGAKVLAALVQAQVQPITSPQGTTLLQATGNSVVVPGDTFVLTVDGATFKARRVQISTTYKGDPVTLTATYATMKSGLTYAQFCTAEVPAKQATVMIHNFDYVPND